MTDIIIEVACAVVASLIFVYLYRLGRRNHLSESLGWNWIVRGFACLAMAMIIDITDNFESLNWMIVVGDTEAEAVLEKVFGYLLGVICLAYGFWRWMPTVMALRETRMALEKANQELAERAESAAAEVKILQGIIPICSHCKQIRDESGAWNMLEQYISEHSEVMFSHGICPGCTKQHYPDYQLGSDKPGDN